MRELAERSLAYICNVLSLTSVQRALESACVVELASCCRYMESTLYLQYYTGQCKRTGGCYNELVVAFFSTGGGVKGKRTIPVDFMIYL